MSGKAGPAGSVGSGAKCTAGARPAAVVANRGFGIDPAAAEVRLPTRCRDTFTKFAVDTAALSPSRALNAMTGDLRQIVEGVLLVFAALFPIVNPLGGAPLFLAMTADCTPQERASLARRVATNAFVLLVASVATGSYVLEFFGLSVAVVQVAGGTVVSAFGWSLLHHPGAVDVKPSAAQVVPIGSRAFYPLTLPLTVGPGSISVAITIGANHPQSVRSLLINGPAMLIGVALVSMTVLVAYRYADRISRVIGDTGMAVLLRLSAFILLCIGVQILWNGAGTLLSTLPVAAR